MCLCLLLASVISVRPCVRPCVPNVGGGGGGGGALMNTKVSLKINNKCNHFIIHFLCTSFLLGIRRKKIIIKKNINKKNNLQSLFTLHDKSNGASFCTAVLKDLQSYRRCRNDELVLCRARFGRTQLTQ